MKSKRDRFFRLVAKILNVEHPTLIVDITLLLEFLLNSGLIKNRYT